MRYTKKQENTYILIDNNQDEAVNKLGLLEDIIDQAINDEKKLKTELEQLRNNHETKSYKFREALGRKLFNNYLIELLKEKGLLNPNQNL